MTSQLKFNLATALVLALLYAVLGFYQAEASADDLKAYIKNSAFQEVGAREQIDPYLLYAISLTESRLGSDSVRPSQFAIGTPGGAIQPKTLDEAVDSLEQAILRYGSRRVDIGIMQINGCNWKLARREGYEIADLFDAKTNILIAAKILKAALKSAPENITLGVGRYHSYTQNRALTYGRRVMKTYLQLKKPAKAEPPGK